MIVNPAPLAISPSTLPNATQGTAYSQQLTVSGGTGTGYLFSLDATSGPLPGGISFSNTGLISGTPTAAGTFPIVVRVSDSASNHATFSL